MTIRTSWIFLIVIILTSLCVALIFYFVYEAQLKNFKEEQEKAIYTASKLIEEGRYDEGIKICNDVSNNYATTIACHSYIIQHKLDANETLSAEFCNSIPLIKKRNLPFTLKVVGLLKPKEAEQDDFTFRYNAQKVRDWCLTGQWNN